MMFSRFLSLSGKLGIVCAAMFSLSACGDNYDMIRTTEMFPYGNQRTAGSGVAYVQQNIMPEKKLKLEPAKRSEPVVQPIENDEIIEKVSEDMNKVFIEEQKK